MSLENFTTLSRWNPQQESLTLYQYSQLQTTRKIENPDAEKAILQNVAKSLTGSLDSCAKKIAIALDWMRNIRIDDYYEKNYKNHLVKVEGLQVGVKLWNACGKNLETIYSKISSNTEEAKSFRAAVDKVKRLVSPITSFTFDSNVSTTSKLVISKAVIKSESGEDHYYHIFQGTLESYRDEIGLVHLSFRKITKDLDTRIYREMGYSQPLTLEAEILGSDAYNIKEAKKSIIQEVYHDMQPKFVKRDSTYLSSEILSTIASYRTLHKPNPFLQY